MMSLLNIIYDWLSYVHATEIADIVGEFVYRY